MLQLCQLLCHTVAKLGADDLIEGIVCGIEQQQQKKGQWKYNQCPSDRFCVLNCWF